nr:hypothetical protein Iba_chr11eCG14240 [Ipomoea batatas]
MENSSANAQESGTTVINALLIPNFIANLTLLQTDFSLYGLNPGSKNQFPYSSSFTVLFLPIIQNQVIESRRQLHHDAAAALPLLLPVIILCRPYPLNRSWNYTGGDFSEQMQLGKVGKLKTRLVPSSRNSLQAHSTTSVLSFSRLSTARGSPDFNPVTALPNRNLGQGVRHSIMLN